MLCWVVLSLLWLRVSIQACATSPANPCQGQNNKEMVNNKFLSPFQCCHETSRRLYPIFPFLLRPNGAKTMNKIYTLHKTYIDSAERNVFYHSCKTVCRRLKNWSKGNYYTPHFLGGNDFISGSEMVPWDTNNRVTLKTKLHMALTGSFLFSKEGIK